MKFIDLFAGIGGFYLGMEQAGHGGIVMAKLGRDELYTIAGVNQHAEFEKFNVSSWSEKAIEHIESDKVAYIPALPMHRKHITENRCPKRL